MSTPLDRLRSALGPGGYRRADVINVCEWLETTKLELHTTRHKVRQVIRSVREHGRSLPPDVVAEMLEDAIGEEVV